MFAATLPRVNSRKVAKITFAIVIGGIKKW